MTQELPVAIIGAGPVGLAAAAHLLAYGETPLIFEAGASVGANMQKWGHVRVFTPWRYISDKAARKLLENSGWEHPNPEAFPTGTEIVQHYLAPLANLPEIAANLRLNSRVLSVSREGFDKMSTVGRENAPFLLRVADADGSESQYRAKAVIDASGTYQTPNPLGANGVAALGEKQAQEHIFYGIPDVLGKDRARYARRKVLVVGSGHSAFNAIMDLMSLAEAEPETEIIWAVRRAKIGQMFGGGDDDALSARGELGARVRALVESGALKFVTGFRLSELRLHGKQVEVIGETGSIETVDEIIGTTGFRPELSIISELRLGLDSTVESTPALAPLIDPNLHSCGTVRPHGAEELKHPEANFYVIGMKSYGRAPTFLMLTGYEQARSVVAAIAGDWEAAREVQLELPETGVCVSNSDAGSCCAEPAASDSGACCTVPAPATVEIRALDIPVLNVIQVKSSNCC